MITENFKQMLLKYITGNFNKEDEPLNAPEFIEPKTIQNNLQDYIQNNLVGKNNILVFLFIEGKNLNNEGLFKNVVYGTYEENQNVYGFFVVVDENLKPIKFIKTYSNNQKIDNFIELKTNHEGKFIGICNKSYESKDYRLVFLNNFLIDINKKYEVKLSKTIKLNNEINNWDNKIKMEINKNGGNYCLFGTQSIDLITTPVICDISINVGNENEYKFYRLQTNKDIFSFEFFDAYCYWDKNNNINCFMVGRTLKNKNDEPVNEVSLIRNNINNIEDKNLYSTKIWDLNQDLISSDALINSASQGFIGLVELNWKTKKEEATILYFNPSKEKQECYLLKKIDAIYTSPYVSSYIVLNSIENDMFFMSVLDNDDTEINKKINIGRFVPTTNKELLSANIPGTIVDIQLPKIFTINLNEEVFFYVAKQFNLYIYYVQVKNEVYIYKQVYNEFNYNGKPYNNYNGMVSNSNLLYDEKNNLIFAKNLYNKLIQNDRTIATIQIPNLFINDIKINKESLVGETNKELINEDRMIIKNIYEEVLINYIYQIIVEDRNGKNIKYNKQLATEINQSINNLLDYENMKIAKYKIVYKNNEEEINKISFRDIIYNGNKATYKITFKNDTNKPVKEIQLLSNNEQTIYLNIDCSKLENGNNLIYTLKQDLEVK